jgi:hypothetical protein
MNEEISPALARALSRGDAPFGLFYCDHPSGAVRLWSRTGILRFAGFDWTGAGILGKMVGATRSTDLRINEVTFELRGVPPTTAELLSGRVRNRVARVWRGAINRRGVVTVDYDEPIIDAVLDYQKLVVDPAGGTAAIQLIGQQGFYLLDRAQDVAFSDQQQRSEHDDDCGMALIHTFVNRESNWRRAA